MDSYGRLVDSIPEQVEVKLLAGTMVWLRDEEHEWTGPAEEALALLGGVEPSSDFWTVFV